MLWVDPNPSTLGAATAPAPDVSTSAGNQLGTTSLTDEMSSFILREDTGAEPGTMVVDALRIGLTWADVTPVALSPFPITSVSVDGTATHLTITWQSVNGVTYHVIGSATATGPRSGWTAVSGTTTTASGTSASVTFAIPTTPAMTYFAVVSP